MQTLMRLIPIFVLILLAGCAGGEASPAPPEIRYGEDICAECSMIISDARFAAGYAHEVTEGRFESKAFDDIGGMLVHSREHPEDEIDTWYVHDFEDEEWLDATEALFVVGSNIPTPMGYGILAFGDAPAAEKAAEVAGGSVLTWDELLASDIAHGH